MGGTTAAVVPAVDMVHVDIRADVSRVDTDMGQDLRAGKDCTERFERARDRVEAHGMKLNNVFLSCWREIPLGEPGADEATGAWCAMLESLGGAGIPNLGWNFKPMGNFRTPADVGRGGAAYSTFDYDHFMANRPALHDPPVTEQQMWERNVCRAFCRRSSRQPRRPACAWPCIPMTRLSLNLSAALRRYVLP